MPTFMDKAGLGKARGFDARDGPALKMGEAIDLMLSRVRPVAEVETVSLVDGLRRVLAAELVSGIDVPGYDNSAMDGYAVRFEDVAEYGGRLRVTQRISAGAVGAP